MRKKQVTEAFKLMASECFLHVWHKTYLHIMIGSPTSIETYVAGSMYGQAN